MILFGVFRIVLKQEINTIRLNILDKITLIFVIIKTLTYVLLWQSFSALIMMIGSGFDILGIYFLSRFFIQRAEDIFTFFRLMSVLLILIATFVTIEAFTGKNLFYIFGGLPEFSEIRDGIVRCRGPFGHSISMGIFAAMFIPYLYYTFFIVKTDKVITLITFFAILVIEINTGSSTPIISMIAAIFGCLMWSFRYYYKNIYLSFTFLLVTFQVFMNAPVYHLIKHFSLFDSSSIYHRFELIDEAINRFAEWWFVGTKGVANWGYLLGDTANHFVGVAVGGGIFSLITFILIIVISFKTLGWAIIYYSKKRNAQYMALMLGTMLFACIVSFFGISLWDQLIIAFYTNIALIALIEEKRIKFRNLSSLNIVRKLEDRNRFLNKHIIHTYNKLN